MFNEIESKNYLLIGAGESAYELIDDIYKNKININLVGILDDLEEKQKIKIKKVSVLGKIKEIKKIIKNYKIQIIVICIEKIPKKTLEYIIDNTSGLKVRIKIIPAQKEYLTKSISFAKVRDISAEDIIGRKNIALTRNIIEKKFANKTVFITGAGGTIGSALCHQLMDYPLKKIICLCRGENSLYLLKEFLQEENKNQIPIEYHLGNVKDFDRMEELLKKEKTHILFHAAAHKHVPLMEENEKEAIKNNLLATLNLLQLAQIYKLENFVFISTDKAVNPKNVMGASKKLAENLVNYFSKYEQVPTCIVRFGNVVGSRGSVVPLFKRQISKGGPITITHPEVERYFMTIPEAASLVINAVALSSGQDTYMLDMGEAVKIDKLVKRLILAQGYRINKDMKIKYTGLRSGEKLNEELYLKSDSILPTINQNIYEIQEKGGNLKKLHSEILKLKKNLKKHGPSQIRKWIEKTLKIELS